MIRSQVERLVLLLEEVRQREEGRRFYSLFPDDDIARGGEVLFHAREKYPRHLEFFGAGATHRERCLMAANRVGKTVAGAFETSAHLTGLYPKWWAGRRFKGATRVWAAGKTNETTRDIVQKELLGEVMGSGPTKRFSGTGTIPRDCIGAVSWKQGVADLADTVKVRNTSGQWSTLGLKSYQQGRGSFEGTAQHAVWFDEEPPLDVYGEALIRTATTDGLIYLTFTPLEGLSETVLQFMPQEMRPEAA